MPLVLVTAMCWRGVQHRTVTLSASPALGSVWRCHVQWQIQCRFSASLVQTQRLFRGCPEDVQWRFSGCPASAPLMAAASAPETRCDWSSAGAKVGCRHHPSNKSRLRVDMDMDMDMDNRCGEWTCRFVHLDGLSRFETPLLCSFNFNFMSLSYVRVLRL